MRPRVAPAKRSTRRIIEDEESEGEDAPDGSLHAILLSNWNLHAFPEGQYDDEDDEQGEEAYEEDEAEYDELEEDDEDDYGVR
jgi:hypothetical protein